MDILDAVEDQVFYSLVKALHGGKPEQYLVAKENLERTLRDTIKDRIKDKKNLAQPSGAAYPSVELF